MAPRKKSGFYDYPTFLYVLHCIGYLACLSWTIEKWFWKRELNIRLMLEISTSDFFYEWYITYPYIRLWAINYKLQMQELAFRYYIMNWIFSWRFYSFWKKESTKSVCTEKSCVSKKSCFTKSNKQKISMFLVFARGKP